MIKSLLRKAALFLVLQPFVFLHAFGQGPNYGSWEIDPGSLTNQQFFIIAGETRTITFSVTASNNPSPVGITIKLYRKPAGSSTTIALPSSQPFTITNADFPVGQSVITKPFQLNVTAAAGQSLSGTALRHGDKLILGIGDWRSSNDYDVRVDYPSAAPVNLKATVLATPCAGVTLTWSSPGAVPVIDRYQVAYRKPGAQVKYIYTEWNQRTVTIDNLDANTAYSFSVSAVNEAGPSPESTTTVTSAALAPGATRSNAIEVRLEGSNLLYNFFPNNSKTNCFGNDFTGDASNEFNGQPSDDIYYKVISSYYGTLQISTCVSPDQDNIRIHVLDANGNWMRHVVEAYPPVCASYNTSRTLDVRPGVYYVIVERADLGEGQINLKMSLNPMNVPGITWTLPIHLGVLDACGRFSDYLPDINASFRDQYGWTGDDVFYRFRLVEPTTVRIGNCNDTHPDFAVYLFDSLYQFIAKGDVDNCLLTSRVLPPGEYTVMFEGEADSYPFSYGMAVSIETQDCNRGSRIAPTGASPETLQRYQQTVNERAEITIYPVPASGTLTIDVHAATPYSVSMTDIYGRPVKTWSTLQGTNSLDISQVREGVYVVQVRNGDRTTVKRVEVKR